MFEMFFNDYGAKAIWLFFIHKIQLISSYCNYSIVVAKPALLLITAAFSETNCRQRREHTGTAYPCF